jgi:hypothetical protein
MTSVLRIESKVKKKTADVVEKLDPEYGGYMFFRNVGISANYMALQSRVYIVQVSFIGNHCIISTFISGRLASESPCISCNTHDQI